MTIEKRVTSDGVTNHRVKVRLKGHPPVTATFSRVTDARRWKQQTESAIRDGRHFKYSEGKKHTLGELVDRYIADVLPTKPKSEKQQKPQLLWRKREIGCYLLSDVTPALIVQQRDKLLKGITRSKRPRSPSTVIRYLAAMSHAFTIAMKEWDWVEDTPFRRVSKPKEPRGRERFLSVSERESLVSACKQSDNRMLYSIVVLAISTGMRCGEILGMTWDAVDLEKDCVVLRDTKNGDTRSVAITGLAKHLLVVLDKVRRIDTNLVFPNTSWGDKVRPLDFRKAWGTAMKKADVKNFRFHDLRHTAASYMAMDGATTGEIAGVLGHRTLQMVKRYAHFSESHRAGVIRSMNNSIFGVEVAKLEEGGGVRLHA